MNFDHKSPSGDGEGDEVYTASQVPVSDQEQARKKWKSISDTIFVPYVEQLKPLTQMMLKKKHEEQIFEKM